MVKSDEDSEQSAKMHVVMHGNPDDETEKLGRAIGTHQNFSDCYYRW